MYGVLKSFFQRPRHSSLAARTAQDGVRLGLEELEHRTVPNASSILQALHVHLDVKDIQADIQAVTRAISTNVSPAVTADLKALNTSLKAVVADLSAGRSATADVTALLNAQSQLFKDLGSNISSLVRHDLSGLGNELIHLTRDLSSLAQVIRHDLTDVQQDVQALSAALASSTSPAIIADLKALNADLDAVAADLAAGRSAVQDLKKLTSDEAKLSKDLDPHTPHDVRVDILDLRLEMRDLSLDLSQVKRLVSQNLSHIQVEVQRLTTALASNLSPKVVADVNTLNSHLSTLVADLSAGRPIASDVNTIITDVNTLITDLGTNVNSVLQQQLRALRGNLLSLALEVALLAL